MTRYEPEEKWRTDSVKELEKISDRMQASMCVNEDGSVEVCEECAETGHGCTCTNNLNAYDWEE